MWRLKVLGVFLIPVVLCGVLGLTNSGNLYTSTDTNSQVVSVDDYSTPTLPAPTVTPVSNMPITVYGPPDVCYDHSCDDYGNGGTSTGSKSKHTYPYTIEEIRYNRNGTPYVYTRVVTAPPVKATIAP